MGFCPRCGVKLPRDKDLRFCPNCGSSIHAARKPSIWGDALEIRIISLAVIFILCVLSTLSGALAKISVEDANKMNRELEELRNSVSASAVQTIFGNNYMHTLIMFIPIAGPGWGFYVLHNTGRFIAAISVIERVNPVLLTFTLFLYPFTWMEYISYTLAISESIMLTYSIFKRTFKSEFIKMSIIAFSCAVILLLAALIETALMFI